MKYRLTQEDLDDIEERVKAAEALNKSYQEDREEVQGVELRMFDGMTQEEIDKILNTFPKV